MAIKEPKKQFDFVVHRNGFNENVAVFDESKWLATDAFTLSGNKVLPRSRRPKVKKF